MRAFSTPILFLTFNRPEHTERVFEEIRKIRPERLFISSDGPREDHPEDRERVQRTREIFSHIDWPCDVKTLFHEKNLGCAKAPPTAIDWFFGHTDAGIILEDDCLPDSSFFPFCAELLERYAKDERVMQISGNNFQEGNSLLKKSYSYYISYIPYLWGWATWKRAWTLYDKEMRDWPQVRVGGSLKKILGSSAVYEYWETIWDSYYAGNRNSWDRPWAYASMRRGGLCLNPSINLISNIGFGPDATHTKNPASVGSAMAMEQMHFPLNHPPTLDVNRQADTYAFKHQFGIERNIIQKMQGGVRRTFPLPYRALKNILKRI